MTAPGPKNPEKKATIMVVDDTQENLVLLATILQPEGYKVMTLLDGKMAVDAARLRSPDLILMDIMMPKMDGYTACGILKADPKTASIPVIFLSALSDPADKIKAFEKGAVDYITKPFNVMEVRARVGVHLELKSLRAALEAHNAKLEEKVRQQVEELSQGHLSLITTMTKLATVRDTETGEHIERTRRLCRLMAQLLGKDPRFSSVVDQAFMENIYNASPLHDIGKVAISDAILRKDDELTPEEYERMKQHTVIGAEYLAQALAKSPKNSYLKMGMEIAGNHHERWDGSGYPAGISGQDIPLSARIMSLADVYDALRSERVYKRAIDHAEVVAMIAEQRALSFDPAIVDIFMEHHSEFEDIRDSQK
ncbi:MAG: response regulator [Spirochaetia bacterium]|jgi:putative two-component system response regulator|nr:response regulator [Spirochaetia bacterium]